MLLHIYIQIHRLYILLLKLKFELMKGYFLIGLWRYMKQKYWEALFKEK